MLKISAINYYLVVALISMMIFGLILICRHQQRGVYRRFVVIMLLFWTFIMSGMVYRFCSDGLTLTVNSGVANMQILLLGLPCFFTLISFPAAILDSNFVKFKNWILLTLPMALFLGVYFVWHGVSGIDPFVRYSAEDFLVNIATPTIWMRLVIVTLFIMYIVVSQIAMWQIVPIYNRYINENFSDNSYNVDWVRSLIGYIVVVSVMYFVMTFSDLLYVNTLYLLSVIMLFGFVIDRSLFYKTFDVASPLKLGWSIDFGWYVCDQPLQRVEELVISMDVVGAQIDEWMDKTLKYTKADFVINDVLFDFPDLTHDELTNYFKSKGETFQSYVRRFRIKRACEIMNLHSDDIYPKQLFGIVGFSHYSSFSRSFFSVMSQSPSDYLNSVRLSRQGLDSTSSSSSSSSDLDGETT